VPVGYNLQWPGSKMRPRDAAFRLPELGLNQEFMEYDYNAT
jgi:hypothetical protein